MFVHKFFYNFSGRLLTTALIFFTLFFGAYFLYPQINLADAQNTFNICLSDLCRLPATQEMNIDAHCINYRVKNNGPKDIFIPTKTATEIQEFILYYPATVELIDSYGGDVVCPTVIHQGITYNSIFKHGLCWLDRNLGASQICTSSTDEACYGDLYQWGRDADGHQIRTSGTTATLSTTDTPGHGNFITTSVAPDDWRNPQNDNLWQGALGANNPCPAGWRLPTQAELNMEKNSWCTNNSDGAFSSRLKFPNAGSRDIFSGNVSVGSVGHFWSSSVSSEDSSFLYFGSIAAALTEQTRAYGASIRCVRAPDSFVLTYSAGEGGSISGQAEQILAPGVEASPVTAVPNEDFRFIKWSDGQTDNPRQDINVTADISVSAEFFSCGNTTVNHNGLVYGTILKDGKCWLDRNLGASQVCESSTDAACYGDLYQWGRGADGHQIRTSGTTATLSSTDTPGHANFITNFASPYDWRNPQNINLWQGAGGINNPCPSGFRLPTDAELTTEINSWSSQNAAGAFGSSLKFPIAGYRDVTGGLYNVGSNGYLWCSAVSGTSARYLYFYSSSASLYSNFRASGHSVRCLRDYLSSLTYSAGEGGSIIGQTEQMVAPGFDGSPVIAVPDAGYSFVRWSDGQTNNPRQDINVTSDISVSAEFEFISCGHTSINHNDLVYGTILKDGKCWLDRNLGASQVCESSTDAACYGDLYQWGRGADGHQIRTSGTTATLSSTDTPGHANFITNSASPYDWRNPQNINLWQGAGGINNPCPSGFRLPTDAELTTEINSWSSLDSAGAFASPLKLPLAGNRYYAGFLNGVGSYGYLWSSAVSGTNARSLYFYSSSANLSSTSRAYGFSVRCLRDDLVYSLTYSAGEGGSIIGQTEQIVNMGLDGTSVTVVPDTGYTFIRWSDDRTDNPRQDIGVVDNINVFAIFSCGTIIHDSLVYGTILKDGKCWLDRHLGATQACTSSTDANCYGHLYQWGRLTDGHQIRTSGTTATLSTTDAPGHGDFITTSVSPHDWRSPQNNNLWQGVSGINNPCPTGFRLPTEAELTTEINSWSSLDSAGAFASPLKLPLAGYRNYTGSLGNVGSYGYLWCSTVSGTYARGLRFHSSSAYLSSLNRAYGLSVRCLRD